MSLYHATMTHLDVVRQKGGAGEAAADVAADVDDDDTPGADEFLEVAHEQHLDEHGDHHVQDAVNTQPFQSRDVINFAFKTSLLPLK